MKGKVLGFSIQKGGGLILGDDGYITDMSCNHQCHRTLCISVILKGTHLNNRSGHTLSTADFILSLT